MNMQYAISATHNTRRHL